MVEYNKGDKVKIIKTGIVKEIIDFVYDMPIVGTTSIKMYLLDDMKVYKLRDIARVEESLWKNCDCGAKFTEFPMFHYDWCSMYRKK